MTQRLLGSVLFACDHNAVRSPVAEGLMKQRFGNRVYVDSVGVRGADLDPFSLVVLKEAGVELSRHRGKTFSELQDTSFDVIVALSPGAQHSAVELTRTMACELEFWPTEDPTAVRGSRDVIVTAYRDVRDAIAARVERFFGDASGASEILPRESA